jgi:ribosome maturation factor RimP
MSMEKLNINAKIEEIVLSQGFLLIDINIRGDHHLKILEIFIDDEKGVTVEDCSKVSRIIDETIQSMNLIESNYRLDVSSPGVDRPLKFIAQYGKHIGRKFEVEYKEGEEIKKITSKLSRLDSDDIFFDSKNSEN